MILVLTRDVVLLEAMELAKYKIATALSCDPSLIKVNVEWKDGKPAPTFGVPEVAAEGLEHADVREVLSSVYWGVRHELVERLRFLDTRRPKVL